MKTVLLTGATGFVGRHCIKPLLQRGFTIHATTTKPHQLASDRLTWHITDLHDHAGLPQLLNSIQPSHLLHLAWFAKPDEYWTSPQNTTWLMTSMQLLNAFIASGGKRAVFTGTCAEYDWSYEHCHEFKTPCGPSTIYGAAKHALYLLGSATSKQQQLSFAWARIFYLFGAHEYAARLVPSIITSLLQGNSFSIKNSMQVRDFMYVEDVARALVSLLVSEVIGPVNIASGTPMSLRELASTIATTMGSPHAVHYANETSMPMTLTADTSRLKQEVNWQPRHTLQNALDETIAWWRASQYG